MEKNIKEDIQKEIDFSDIIEKKGTKKFKLICATLFISVVLVFSISMLRICMKYRGYTVEHKIENITTDTYFYKVFCDGLIEYSNNGMSYKVDDDMVWNYPNKILKPVIDFNDNQGVMADIDNNMIIPFTSKSLGKGFKINRKIILVKAIPNGDIGVLNKDGDNYYINIYDKSGKDILEVRSSITTNGVPMDFSIAKDNKKMFVVYLHVDKNETYSKFVTYDISDENIEEENKITSAYKYESEILSRIYYIDDNNLAIIGNKKIYTYNLEENIDKESNGYLPFSQYVFVKHDSIIQIGNDADKGFISISDKNMVKKLYKNIKEVYNKIYVSDKEIIFIGDTSVSAYRFNGQHIFKFDFNSKVKDIVDLGDGTYIVTLDNEILKIKPTIF